MTNEMNNPGDFGLARILIEAVHRQPPGKLSPEEKVAADKAVGHVADYCAEIGETDFAEMTPDQVDEVFRRFLMHYRRNVQNAAHDDFKRAMAERLTPETQSKAA